MGLGSRGGVWTGLTVEKLAQPASQVITVPGRGGGLGGEVALVGVL